MAKFDNLDDVQNKFAGTICYYDGQPVAVKSAHLYEADPTKYSVAVCPVGGRYKYVLLDDPAFRYRDYNIGYANSGLGTGWWYRKPVKQFHQGLRFNQMGVLVSPGQFVEVAHFQFSKSISLMLANEYPSLEKCKAFLMENPGGTIAFHKDFALSRDEIHDDYILEFRTKKIGGSLNHSLTEFKLIDNAKHLRETLQEAVG
jgi:hypothetical protein